MRLLRICVTAAAAVALAVGPAAAQGTFDRPLDEPVPYHADSGWVGNRSAVPAVAYTEIVSVEDAGWLRLFFGQVQLGPGSFLRVTSDLDGESQTFDADALEMWSHSTAYFNGSSVALELVAGPDTPANRVVVERVSWEAGVAVPTGDCGFCGPDKRVLSDVVWASRLLPAGCSASIYNTMSCAVSAGHCIGGSMVLEFHVPLSNSNCTLNHPPIAEQFPVTGQAFTNGGIGNDWAALTVGTNNLGQQPFDRYGEFRPIATSPPVVGEPLTVWGYGVDSQCTHNQVQQTSDGDLDSVQNTSFRHNVDVTFGNSGSGVMRNGEEILGIVTHCPCPTHATRVDHPSFAAAREDLCPSVAPTDAQLDGATVVLGTPVSGGLPELLSSDDVHFVVASATQGSRNSALTLVDAQLPFSTVSGLGLTVEYGPANAAPVFLSVQILNHETGLFDVLQFGIVPETSDALVDIEGIPSPNDYVDDQGQVQLRVAQTARAPQTPDGFTKLIDRVRIFATP